MRPPDRTAEREIAQIAARSHGVVTRGDLLQAGVTHSEIRHRLRVGALLREYPGVYRAGHRAPNLHARYLAAVRACGRGALLAGPSAAALFGLIGGAPPPHVVALTERRIEGVVTSRTRRPDRRDATSWRGIPVTTVARTLVDLAGLLQPGTLARACHEAEVRYRTEPADIEAVLSRRPASPGAARLRQVLTGEVRVTLSGLEARFLELLGQAELALPQTNRRAGGRRVDCRWPDQRLTVELDSYRYHRSRHAWELDHRREREARARGDDFRRYTYGDVFEDPRPMLAELRSIVPQTRPRNRPGRPG